MDRATYDRELQLQLIKHEGLRLQAYHCPAGKLTIGVGRNLESPGLHMSELDLIQRRDPNWRVGDAITQPEAMLLLRNDLARVERELQAIVPAWDGDYDRKRMALVDMCFNLGRPRFLKFVKMLAAANAGDWDTAAKEMLKSKWATQVGKRAVTLSTMMREG